ncbi:MAG TPA: MarR family winged helix-turn-helix transcriptional regulator [Anaerolineae bacterium]|nr:MarR family winged helix-turn-helix transcriptional regulator [Anaerolineae bacterium]
MKATPEHVAAQVVEVVPLVMRSIREHMRKHRQSDLTVTQFRTLGFIDRNAGASLSDVADHIGLALPSMSKLIDGLVRRKLVVREFDTIDRRRVTLSLTARGRSILETARSETRAVMTQTLASLERNELETILAAMQVLRPLFTSPREAQRAGKVRQNGHS